MIALSDYLIFGAVLFMISMAGIFLKRKNVIVLLLSIELFLLSFNSYLGAFLHYLNDLAGQRFCFFFFSVSVS